MINFVNTVLVFAKRGQKHSYQYVGDDDDDDDDDFEWFSDGFPIVPNSSPTVAYDLWLSYNIIGFAIDFR